MASLKTRCRGARVKAWVTPGGFLRVEVAGEPVLEIMADGDVAFYPHSFPEQFTVSVICETFGTEGN